MKVSKKVHGLLFVACMVLVMVFCMSYFMTWVNAGFVADFVFLWMKNFGMGFTVAFPIAALTVPLIHKLLDRFLQVEV